jgi:hypothetical protein
MPRDEAPAILPAEPGRLVDLERLKSRLATRLNAHLIDMKPDHDDSIVGFNEAWDIIRKALEEPMPKISDMPGIADALGFDPMNHHNAAVCPYCWKGAPGWIVANGDQTKFRFWAEMGPDWTTSREHALRFARRQDAEAFCADDEDAWHILPIGTPSLHRAENSAIPMADGETKNICHDVSDNFNTAMPVKSNG